MKVYVLVSDVGLNGYIIHGVYDMPPLLTECGHAAIDASRTTGYQSTIVEVVDLIRTGRIQR